MKALFYQSQSMHEYYSLHSGTLLVDATFKTNSFNMPLVILAGIDSNNKTVLFGFALI